MVNKCLTDLIFYIEAHILIYYKICALGGMTVKCKKEECFVY